MCRNILLAIILTAMVVIATMVAAANYIGWWAAPLVLLGWIIVAKWAAKRAVMWLMLTPFRMKGQVLRGASVELHALDTVAEPSAAHGPDPIDGNFVRAETLGPVGQLPPGDEDFAAAPAIHTPEAEDYTPRTRRDRNFIRIDATITPRPHAGRMRHWEPASLSLVAFGVRIRPSTDPASAPGNVEPVAVEARIDGRWQPAAGLSVEGPLRVRLTFRRDALPSRAKLRYYFESLGDMRINS